jgi:hypothetical protein
LLPGDDGDAATLLAHLADGGRDGGGVASIRGKGGGRDGHVEMPLALARVAGVLVPFVGHHQRFGRQGSRQQRMDLGDFRFRHGLHRP